jgi:hypothetical protein
MNRRRVFGFIGSASLVALAGCSTESTPDLYFRNGGTVVHTVEFEVSQSGETVIQDRFELEADDSTSYEDPITESGSYEITVTTDSGLEKSFTWEETNEPQEADGDGTHVRIEDEEIQVERVVGA